MDRQKFLELIGPLPVRPGTLNIKTIEVVDCGSYSRHKIEYDVELNEHVSAYVCIPKDIVGTVPGIFCHHQHNGEFNLGKSEVVGLAGNPEQAYASELAERGYVTFAVDALAFEDRNWHDEPFLAETYEATARISQGKTFMAKLLHDISIALDVLCSTEGVNAGQIGFIGHSYGGKMAFWAAAYDNRIKAAVSHCGSTSIKRSLEQDAGVLPELTIPSLLHYGDMVDVAKLANASFLISGTTQDVWSEDAEALHEELRASSSVYSELARYDDVHRFSKEMRENAYTFLGKQMS
jgi:dienelactone hydrolase